MGIAVVMRQFSDIISCSQYVEGMGREGKDRRLPGRRALVVVFIKNMLFEIIAFVVFEFL